MKQKIIVATGNKNKLREIAEIFPDFEIVSQKDAGFFDDVEENGSTFEENALIKAKAVCEKLHVPALADDSGICVEALGGAPGIFSARYSGEHGNDAKNREKLLKDLEGVENRKAWFVCAVALVFPDGSSVCVRGETYGKILYKEDGNGGFGYDPLFYSDDLEKSFGVASPEEKNGVSHRFRALTALKQKMGW